MSRPIVVGIDGSAASERAAAWAARQADATGAPLVLVNAYAAPSTLNPMSLLAPPDVAAQLASIGQATSAELTAKLLVDHPNLTIEQRVVEGSPGSVLAAAAQGAALLVVGAEGVGRVSRLVLGSVVRSVLVHAPSPVAIVP